MKIASLIFSLLLCSTACSQASFDPDLADACDISDTQKKKSLMSRMQGYQVSCDGFTREEFLIAKTCSRNKYTDAVSSYAIVAILNCASCNEITEFNTSNSSDGFLKKNITLQSERINIPRLRTCGYDHLVD